MDGFGSRITSEISSPAQESQYLSRSAFRSMARISGCRVQINHNRNHRSEQHQTRRLVQVVGQEKVDTYFDLYVAGVWNVFRVARLLIVALIIKLSEASEENEDCSEYISTVNCIVEAIISSVPYHLTGNLHVFLGTSSLNKEIIDSGSLLGGLLLIHPLSIVSELPFISRDMRDHMRTCLAWIGSEMGFGQATLLSNVREILKPIAGSCWLTIT